MKGIAHRYIRRVWTRPSMNPFTTDGVWSFKKLYLGVFACDVCLVNWPKDMGMVISWLELEVFLALELDIWTTVPSSKTFSSCEDEDVCWVSTFGCCWDTAVSDDAEMSNSCQTSESLIVLLFCMNVLLMNVKVRSL